MTRPTLQYQSPADASSPVSEFKKSIRLIAAMLAGFGTIWGILCAVLLVCGNWRAWLLFSPAYLMTAGYYWRAIGRPSRAWRCAIWGLSLLVQGAWLMSIPVMLIVDGRRGRRPSFDLSMDDLVGFAIVIWWASTFLLSLFCLWLDREPLTPRTTSSTPQDVARTG